MLIPSAFPKARPALVLPPATAEAALAGDTLLRLAELSRRMGVEDRQSLVDGETADIREVRTVPCHDVSRLDLRFFDPGPDRGDIPFGFNCGCCSKFLRWDDPRRQDSVYMSSLLQREHCPRLLLTEQPIPTAIPIEEFIPQADHSGCDAFEVDLDVSPASVVSAVEQLDGMSFEELSVLGYAVYRAFLSKKHGERFGYELGDELIVRKAGRPLSVRVIGFQRKSGEEIIVSNTHDASQVFTIPALRAR